MTLAFPNPSRSYAEARNAVLFFGHDGMFEIQFFVEAKALAREVPRGTRMTEAQCLASFDAMRASILSVAREVYSNNRRNLNTLTAADFK